MALIGLWIGARWALMADNYIFKIVMLVILPITAVFILNKKTLSKYRCPYSEGKTKMIITLLALVMGGMTASIVFGIAGNFIGARFSRAEVLVL